MAIPARRAVILGEKWWHRPRLSHSASLSEAHKVEGWVSGNRVHLSPYPPALCGRYVQSPMFVGMLRTMNGV